jgi:hypothetical protein
MIEVHGFYIKIRILKNSSAINLKYMQPKFLKIYNAVLHYNRI